MTTITNLTATLAEALGLPRRLVDDTARYLREAEMLADGGAPATVEHAVVLLLGLMAAPDPKDAPDAVHAAHSAILLRKALGMPPIPKYALWAQGEPVERNGMCEESKWP